MKKEKLVSLTKYLNALKDKAVNPVPHAKRGDLKSYTQFLKREIEIVSKQLEAAKV